MNKCILLWTLGLLSTATLFSQDVKKDEKEAVTKMDQFASKTGTIIKFQDYTLPSLKASYSSNETRIRKITSASESEFFYQIEKPGTYGATTASIKYSDLVEVIKALKN